MPAEGDLGAQVEGVPGQRGVIAAFGFQRDTHAQAACQPVRKGPRRQNHPAPHRPAGGDDAVIGQGSRLGNDDPPAIRAETVSQCDGIVARVGDGIPAGRECPMGKARCQAGLNLGHLLGCHVPEGNAVIRARLPAGQGRVELPLAFINLKIAVLAQHRLGAACRQERFQFGPGQIHQGRLALGRGRDAGGRTGAGSRR